MAQTPIAVPYRQLTEEDLKGDLSQLNTMLRQIIEAINRLAGNHGAAPINDQIDMQGNQIINVGAKKVTLG